MVLMQEPSPWQPENDKLHLAVLGKLGEEVCELGSAIYRCIIQGIDGEHPVTAKTNREWLEEEIADVSAGIELAIERFGLNRRKIANRALEKKRHKKAWHKLVNT
jgi:NTP pyrophosphatase (non-canonical NTP hydrolase)